MIIGARSLLLLLSLFLASASLTGAHGGGTPYLTNSPAGPYWLSAWVQPAPPRMGELVHFTIAVTEPPAPDATSQEAGVPIPDATVTLKLTPPTGEPLTLPVPPANTLFYEVDLQLPADGRWQAEVSVKGPDGGGQANFELEVEPAPSMLTWWLLAGGAGLIFAVAVWLGMKRKGQAQ